MSLTPLDIQHKEFESKFKGYSKDEVDDFLDLIKKNYEQVLKENKDLEHKRVILTILKYGGEALAMGLLFIAGIYMGRADIKIPIGRSL